MNSRSTDGAKRAAIYREAAQIMERNFYRDRSPQYWYGACDNINYVAMGEPAFQSNAADAFEAVFRPKSVYAYWGDEWGGDHDERRNIRILALCFMAAMVEAGDA